jgi:hypothetical protein
VNTYTFTEARQKLAGASCPQKRKGSPLDVAGIHLNLTRDEILESILESRRVA